MNLPFTSEQFFQLFASYNQAIWPAQLIAYLSGFCAVWQAIKPRSSPSRVIPIALSAFWIWTGLIYHAGYFSAINRAAYFFALLFVLQGGLFISFGKSLRNIPQPAAEFNAGLAISCR